MKAEDAGRFGPFGGRFVPETLISPLIELERAWIEARTDEAYLRELDDRLRRYAGRPTPLTPAPRFAAHCGAPRLYLKREDLAHTGAHKINNAIGQALLAVRMGKTRLIAETGAGQHGVATATVGALFGLRTRIYMGEEDMRRQALNVYRMKLLGAEVTPVGAGSRTLKDAINEAMRDWVENVRTTHYLLGSALGPHPYPTMVRDLQRVIGVEAREQILEAEGRLPDLLIACVGGGSNAIGLFHPFLADTGVAMLGVEAGGEGTHSHRHAARFEGGSVGVLQGTRTFVLQDEAGNIRPTHSISAGLDYAAVGPEHALLRETGRVQYRSVTDGAALEAFHLLAKAEGILPALESAHALAGLIAMRGELSQDALVLLNLSGRGDKDLDTVIAGGPGPAVP